MHIQHAQEARLSPVFTWREVPKAKNQTSFHAGCTVFIHKIGTVLTFKCMFKCVSKSALSGIQIAQSISLLMHGG